MADINVTIEDAQPINVSLGEAVNIYQGGTGDYNDLDNLPDLTLKADKSDTYTKIEVDTSLAGKAEIVHVHTIADVTGLQTALDGKANATDTVNLTGDQTVAGVKTFSSSPVVPTPTADMQVATKKYVDDNSGGGGGGTWGSITGTLADQTDLQNALDLKANSSSLATVATSGDYGDLSNLPTIPAQFNPIAGTNISLSGTYPNITFDATGGGGGGGGNWEEVYDQTVTTTASYWDITGLNLDNDGEYYFDFVLVNEAFMNGWTIKINAASSTYVGQGYWASGSTITSNNSWGNRLVHSAPLNPNAKYQTWGRIIRSPYGGIMITADSVIQINSSSTPIPVNYCIVRAETDNLTSLRISSTDWYVYAGSRFRIWKRVA